MVTLTRPLTCLDLETTSPNPRDARIVQIGIIKRMPLGDVTEWESLVNPGEPIPADATAIHGITDAMVANAPTFASMAPRLIRAFIDVDFLGYNVARFDLEVIREEFKRAGVSTEVPEGVAKARIIDPYVIWMKSEPRTLSDAARRFLGKEPVDAHSALADVRTALAIFEWQSNGCYPDLPDDLDALHAFQFPKNPNAVDEWGKFVWTEVAPGRFEATISFGKHRGTQLRNLDKGFLSWMLKQDFTEEVKDLARNAMQSIFPKREVSSGSAQ